MISDVNAAIASLGGLAISHAAYLEPTLTIWGESWSFATVSAWRVLREGVLLVGWSDRGVSAYLRELPGLSVVAARSQGALMGGDPALALDNGDWLEVFSDGPSDPWVLRLPSITYVGSPSDPGYAN